MRLAPVAGARRAARPRRAGARASGSPTPCATASAGCLRASTDCGGGSSAATSAASTADLATRLVRADGRLLELVGRRRLAAESRVRQLAARLDALSPLAVLGRGYAVCWNESRTSIIRSAAPCHPGDGVRVTLADGELACQVVAPARSRPVTEPEMPDSIKDFESAIAELEHIVKQLEDGDLPLDKSLALFERGVELSRYCHDQLGAAQRRIELLTERGELKDGSHLLEPDDER